MLGANSTNSVNKNIIDCFAFLISVENHTQIFIKLFEH